MYVRRHDTRLCALLRSKRSRRSVAAFFFSFGSLPATTGSMYCGKLSDQAWISLKEVSLA